MSEKNIIQEMQPFVNAIGETWGNIQWHIAREKPRNRRKKPNPNKYKLLKKRSKDLGKRLKDLSRIKERAIYFNDYLLVSRTQRGCFYFPLSTT
jgi:hypothetical protein